MKMLPKGEGSACIDFLAQQEGIGLLIESLQPLLLLLTENSGGEQTLIGRLGLIPCAPHLVTHDDFFSQMHHWLEQIVIEPHALVERVACRDL